MTALINALFEIISSILTGGFNAIIELINLIGKKDHDLIADYGKTKKIKASWFTPKSLYIGGLAISPSIALTSAVIVGKTGAGKSSKIFIPSLLNSPLPKLTKKDSASMSYIVLDPKGEIGDMTAGYNEKKGYQCEYLNFFESDKSTLTWNPLDGLSGTDINRFATEFVETSLRTKNSSDPFWAISASRVVEFSIELLQHFGKQYTNLYNVRYVVELLSGDRKELDELMTLESITEVLFNQYSSVVNMGDKLLGSVLATTLASLSIFKNPSIAKITAKTNFTFKTLREKSSIIYIQTSVMNQEYVSVLNSLFFSSLFRYTMSNLPKKRDNTLAYFIDECSSLRMKPSLIPLATSMLRGYKSYGVFGFQSLSQIEETMGSENMRTVLQNAGTKLFFPGQDNYSSQEISQLLGKYTYQTETGSKHHRELMTLDEVSFCSPNGGILFSGNQRGIHLKKVKPYFKSFRLKSRANQPVQKRKPLNLNLPQLLPIKELIKA